MSRPNRDKLVQAILSLSVAATWEAARQEWEIYEVYKENNPRTCLCGSSSITEICVLKNNKNGKEAIVGNACVEKFFGLSSDRIFDALKRIAKNISNALNPEAIVHANEKGWISDWEKEFYLETCRKIKLSYKQHGVRIQINKRVLNQTVNKFKERT